MIAHVLDWIYPPACMACRMLLPLNDKRRRAIWLCESCEPLLTPAQEGYPKKDFHFTQNRAIFNYEGILRDIMRDIKFRNKKNYASALGRLWADYLQSNRVKISREATFVPLPLHPAKKRERGFNQAELLAKELSAALKIPMEYTLARIIDTPPQAGLHPARRAENVTDAFTLTPSYTATGKTYIIIDDIYTTGASLNECARILKLHGARTVECLTLAYTPKKSQEVRHDNSQHRIKEARAPQTEGLDGTGRDSP
ncbi:MAG: ComF family protein [Defluviitaleaceae bacterium]|nr:ComF family protein [Defluviitaleaceae bacterium]MCL2273370.1 ComF family protein [Defluviitaleaceae bacterium]